MDGLSITEQANIFYHADVVVAVHGAALANLAFCRPGTKIFEILSPNWLWFDRFLVATLPSDIARAAALKHVAILGEVQSDMRVDSRTPSPERDPLRLAEFTVEFDKISAAACDPAHTRSDCKSWKQ